jgi:hypothetical protein
LKSKVSEVPRKVSVSSPLARNVPEPEIVQLVMSIEV